MDRRAPRLASTTAAALRRALLLGCVAAASAAHAAAPPQVPPPARQRQTSAAAPSTLDVTVVDTAARPLAGALVQVLSSVGAFNPSLQMSAARRRSALTNADGKARFASVPRAPWIVSASAPGYAVASEARVSAATLTIRLAKGAAVTGVVLDGTTRAPVPGARVGLDRGLALPTDWEERATRNEAVADAKGAFRLDGLGRGALTLLARAPGYGAGRREGVRPGARVELFLFPGATLRGTVRDEAGRPVKGASVRLQGDGWTSPAPIETSDASGAFVVAGVEPGEYLVVAREGARAPAIDTVVVPARGDATVELTLGGGGFVRGRVVDGAGQPLAGARVRVATFEDRGLPGFLAEALGGASAGDGTFALGPLPSARLGLAVSLARYAPRRLEADVATRQSVDLRDVVLDPGLAIRGRVRDREGNGVAFALVSAQQGFAGASLGADASTGEAESESDGSFVIAGLKPGAHQVSASLPGFASASRSAEPGGEPVQLLLEPGGSVVGRVVDANGQPIDGATVHGNSATQPPGGPGWRFFYASSGGAEGDGRFVARDVAADTYSVTVRAAGQGEGSVANVKVAAGRDTDLGTVTLGSGGRVVGSVVDSEGEAVPGASVLVERDVNVHTGMLTAQTDSAGSFEVRGVPPGKVDVIARHPAYVGGRARGVEVDPEKEPAPVRIVVTRGGRIEGRARHRDGGPFTGARVQVYAERGGGIPGGLDYAATGADGSFVLEHVPAGPLKVNLMTFVSSHPMAGGSPGLTILAGVATRAAEAREGETTTVDITTREVIVAGRVTRGGQGAAGVQVNVMTNDSGGLMSFMGPDSPRATAPPAGPPPFTATSREDGSFELLVFGPGHAWVNLKAEASRQSYPGREVDVPDAERYELDLELGEATVSGTVVEQATGAPVPEATVALRQPGPEGPFKGGSGVSADGRFAIGSETGEFVLEASAPGFRAESLAITVGSAGLADLRLELERGLEIAGRLVDSAGRPVSGMGVVASDPETGRGGRWQYSNTQPDGSFRLSGLAGKPYVVASGSELNGFALRSAVTPGGEPITLALRPGGRVLLRVVGPDGQPVAELYPRVMAWDGVRLDVPGVRANPTGVPGEYELNAPAGNVGLQVGWDKVYGTASATVRAGETTRAEMKLSERPPR